MRFLKIEEAIAWVMKRKNTHHGFQHFKKVMQDLNNPQDTYSVIHIAGTNGKGSTAYYLANALYALHFKVGLFTSPHLINHRDRIRINDTWISETDFLDYLNRFYDLILQEDLSMFEIDMLIASVYYQEQAVDWVIFETGLGGRLDCTNVLSCPKLTMITTVGMDHMELLGNTLEQIAFEKAGIIKPNCPILIGEMDISAQAVIENRASQCGAMLHRYLGYQDVGKQEIAYDEDLYWLSTLAQYQKHNLSLALQALQILNMNIHVIEVKEALKNSLWQGRFEQVGQSPLVLLDGAHNLHGIQALVKSFAYLSKPLCVVFAVLKEKQKDEMIACLRPHCQKLYLTHFKMERAVEKLAFEDSVFIENWQEAIAQAKQSVGVEGTVLITGSLYFVSEVRAYLLKNEINENRNTKSYKIA